MGAYIQTPENTKKADQLLNLTEGTIEVTTPIETLKDLNEDEVFVVVVSNGAFDAAAVAYDEEELAEFTRLNESRPRRYLRMKTSEALRLAPEIRSYLT